MTPELAREIALVFDTEACAAVGSTRPHPLEAIAETDRLSDLADWWSAKAAELARRPFRRRAPQRGAQKETP